VGPRGEWTGESVLWCRLHSLLAHLPSFRLLSWHLLGTWPKGLFNAPSALMADGCNEGTCRLDPDVKKQCVEKNGKAVRKILRVANGGKKLRHPECHTKVHPQHTSCSRDRQVHAYAAHHRDDDKRVASNKSPCCEIETHTHTRSIPISLESVTRACVCRVGFVVALGSA
jgi:hypothetical protein